MGVARGQCTMNCKSSHSLGLTDQGWYPCSFASTLAVQESCKSFPTPFCQLPLLSRLPASLYLFPHSPANTLVKEFCKTLCQCPCHQVSAHSFWQYPCCQSILQVFFSLFPHSFANTLAVQESCELLPTPFASTLVMASCKSGLFLTPFACTIRAYFGLISFGNTPVARAWLQASAPIMGLWSAKTGLGLDWHWTGIKLAFLPSPPPPPPPPSMSQNSCLNLHNRVS